MMDVIDVLPELPIKHLAETLLVVGIDVGTTTCAMSYARQDIRRNKQGKRVAIAISSRDVQSVTFGDNDGKTIEIPSVCAYYIDNEDDESASTNSNGHETRDLISRLHLGSEVEEALERRAIEEPAVLKHVKLAFFDDTDATLDPDIRRIGRHLQDQIREFTAQPRRTTGPVSHLSPEEVLSDLLLHIWTIGKRQIARGYEFLVAQSDVNFLPVLLRIAVPSTFIDAQNQMFKRAAVATEKLEGQTGRAVKTELVTEPTAALADLLEEDPAVEIQVSYSLEVSIDSIKR